MYTLEKFRSNFEAVGAQVRPFFDYNETVNIPPVEKKRQFIGFKIVRFLTQFSNDSAKRIAAEISREKPDLIIYDIMSIYLKWALMYYQKWYDLARQATPEQKAKLEFCPTNKIPPLVCSSPSFVGTDNVYPNKIELGLAVPSFFAFGFILDLMMCVYENLKTCFQLNLGFINPFLHIKPKPFLNTKFVLVTVFPDLQPRAHLFDQSMFRFIGSTINEHVKNEFSFKNHDVLSDILQMKPTLSGNKFEEKDKLIYVSLGSIFNNNIDLYKIILDGLKQLPVDEHTPRVVVSTGDSVYEQFAELIKRNSYTLPKNILLVKSVPQVEILKRASLFITHSGQNSVSESIHYGGNFTLVQAVNPSN